MGAHSKSIDPSPLHEAMARRLYRRAAVTGQVTLPAVPGMIDEYVKMCDNVFADFGVRFGAEDLAQLKTVLANQLTLAYTASPRANIIISFDAPVGSVLNYHVKPQWQTIEGADDHSPGTRERPPSGTEPDARVRVLAGEIADPGTCRVLDIGAGTGRNALALARRGHPVDAVEMTPRFADGIRLEAERDSLDVHVIQSDVSAATDSLRWDYELIVVSEVVSGFRTMRQLRVLFELATRCLAPGGRLVFNAFLPRQGYTPDNAARELGQQCYTTIFTRDELMRAAAGLRVVLVADDSVYEYEKAHLPEGAWPPTNWYANWVSGLGVFDVDREASPIEMRWLVYQKPGWSTRPAV